MKTTYLLTLLPESSSFQVADSIRVDTAEKAAIMAPVPVELSPSFIPTAVVGAHLISVVYLSLVATRTIYRSYLALPPSSATRHREPLRKGHVQTFSVLALLSLATAALFGAKFALLSYRVWATERGIELPESLFGDKGAFRAGEHPGRFHLARWLNDTPVYRDSLEIVAEKARHFWWGQQINLGLISWSTYLSLEGQRRKISNLWAFLALAQLVNLSYAQNLFFIAVLLTPVPLPGNVRDLTRTSIPASSSRFSRLFSRITPSKQDGFLPKPALYISLLLASFVTVFLIPYAANTTAFFNVSCLSGALPFCFLALPYIIPTGWGNVASHPHDSHSTYTTLFRIMSTFSAGLHIKSTIVAIFHNTPDNTYYRHSLLHPFREEHRTVLDRGSTAIGRVFAAMGEHPAVGSVAWDVIFTGLSLGVWAAIRGLDAKDMLRSSIFFTKRSGASSSEGNLVDSNFGGIETKAEKAIAKIDASSNTPRRGPGRPKTTDTNNNTATQENPAPSLAKRRKAGRRSMSDDTEPREMDNDRRRAESEKSRTCPGNTEAEDDEYTPSDDGGLDEGDEDTEEDVETAAFAWGLLSIGGLVDYALRSTRRGAGTDRPNGAQ